MPIKGALLLVYFIASLPLCFVWPFYGILLWVVVAFLNPQSSFLYWQVASEFPWAVAVAVPTLAGFFLLARGWGRRLFNRECGLLVILWAWFLVTSFVSSHTPLFVSHSFETWYKFRFVSKILLMTFVMVAIVHSFERLRILVIVIAGCFAYFVVKSIPFLIVTGGAFRLYGPDNSMIADNNDLGLALNMTVPLFFFLAQTEGRQWVRWFFGVVFLASIPAIFFTYSRGALVGLIAVLAITFLQSKRRLVLLPAFGFGLAIAVLFAPQAWRNRMDPTRPDAIDASAQSRLNAWRYARNLAAEYPITGGGFETFTPELFERYAPHVKDVHGPHSVYFQVLAEQGYVGLGIYLALILTAFWTTFRLTWRARRFGDLQIWRYATMFRFSLVGFLTSGVFLGRAYFDYFFAIVACIAILNRVSRERWQGGGEGPAEQLPEPAEQESALPEGELIWGGER